ncbi:MAG: SpoIIE family protein phosphatase [Thermoguttaceae bacterium]|nr:SpoIIE family protein phosphatase [Thermoguttaceae bacterium]
MSQFNIFSEVDQRVEIETRPCLPSIDLMGSLPALLRSYEKILGWTFRFVSRQENIPSILEQFLRRDNQTFQSLSEAGLSQNAEADVNASDPSSEPSPLLSLFQDKKAGVDSVTKQSGQQRNSVPVEIRLSDGKTHEVGVIEYASAGSVWSSFVALARQAASAIADMVGESLTTRYQLWRRESELASKSVLTNCHLTEDRQLAFMLQDILHGTADALGCVAGAMYLLDDKTSELKMRSCWGLPTERLMEPARPLRGSADLEAMLGRVVILEDENSMREWRSPEDFQSGLCVPIISQSNILGTVWFYSQNARRFSNRQVKMAELTSGHLAAELERDALTGLCHDHESIKKELTAAALIQKNQAPICAPWFEKWDLAGKVRQKRDFGGNFYDWFTMPDGKIVCALADCQDEGITAALTASMVKSSLRSHAQYQFDANDLMGQIDRTIWSSSAADQYVNLFCATLDSNSDRVYFSTAGKIKVYRVSSSKAERLSQETAMLGQTPETEFASDSVELNKNEALVILSSKIECTEKELNAILNKVQGSLARSARHCVRDVCGTLEAQNLISPAIDCSLLVLKRKQ